MKTFAWKILHGRVKARPSGLNTPVTLCMGRRTLAGIRRISYVTERLSLDGFSFTLSYAMEFYYEFPYKIDKNTKNIYPNKVCLRIG